jgi:MFS transporter, PPP family, 3-phenylpropionic acid transporter
LHETFVGHQAQGQALYASFSYGVGGVLGSLLAGYAWSYGGGDLTFGLAALFSLFACALVWKVKQTMC